MSYLTSSYRASTFKPPPGPVSHPTCLNVVIDPNGDLMVRIYRDDPKIEFVGDNGTMKIGHIHTTFRVSSSILRTSSPYFDSLLSDRWMKSNQHVVDIGQPHFIALDLWFQILHGRIDVESYDIERIDIRYALEVGREYILATEKLNDWFGVWLRRKDLRYMETCDLQIVKELVYLCYEFDQPQAFATATRRLVYENGSHITEINPTEYGHLRLPHRILVALNAARGSQRTKLHKAVDRTELFLDSECECKKDGLFAYSRALRNTEVWPLFDMFNIKDPRSLRHVMHRLKELDYHPPNDTCELCSSDFASSVRKSACEIEQNFDGLCIDCMDPSLKLNRPPKYQRR